MEKHSRVIGGLLSEIQQKYVEGNLTETYIVIRYDDKNHFFRFLGLIPDNLLGRAVDFEQFVTEENAQYYCVDQSIMDLDTEAKYRYLIKAQGKLAK